jgi:hypothetical protein
MSFGLYAILIIFGLFVLLLIFNPNLSCFGRTIKSPFYPFFRKRKKRRIEAQDYGFHLVDQAKPRESARERKEQKEEKKPIKTEDYGFILTDDKKQSPSEGQEDKRREH